MILSPKSVTLEELATFVLTSTALVPGLLAFSIGSRGSLKSWLAVQQAPPAPRLDQDVEKSMKRKMMAVVGLTLVAILGLEVYLFAQGNEQTIDRFFTYLFGYVFETAAIGLFVEVTQALQWSVHRGVANTLHFRPQRISRARLLTAAAAATALNVGAYYDAHVACGGALVTAVLVSRLSAIPSKTFSLRGCIFVLLSIVAFVSILSGVAIMAAIKMDKDGEPLPEEPEPIAFASAHVMKYINYFITAFYTMIPGVFIAGCYRYDYSNALDASAETFAPVQLESVEAPACKVGYLSAGVLLPSKAPNWFAKPFYTVALWSWLLAQLSTAGLFALALPFPKALLETGPYTLLSFYLSSIFLVVAVTLTAVFKGEAKKMWTYKEIWITKADKGIVLEGEEGTGPAAEQEETLPAYEAPVVVGDTKEPVVAAYEVPDAKV
ncbi:hypothetical protein JCM3765_004379 [Sporobolomyces pararoseus]